MESEARAAAVAVAAAAQMALAEAQGALGEMERRIEGVARGEAETAERNVALEVRNSAHIEKRAGSSLSTAYVFEP